MQRKRSESIKEFITSDGVGISYDLKGQGIPLVFVHGWSGSQQDFSGTARRLSKRYITLIYDQRGHGFSDHASIGYKLEQLARDLYELISELGLKKIVLVGHSMGGAVVLEYLRIFGHNNVEGIILVDMSPKLINDEKWHLGLYEGTYKEEDFKRDIGNMKEDFGLFTYNFLKNMLPDLRDEKVRGLLAIRNKTVPPPYVAGLIKLWQDMALMDYREYLEQIKIPVGIFRGEFAFYSIKSSLYLKDELARGSIVEFKGCTHQLILEDPRGFEREIEHFIDKEGIGKNNG